ncbi:putative phiE125 gp8 family phage protein [Novosphingobium sp. PhB165]|uniref:head-tail connector protein n=1 Tax=Novosphingobium sp. PhB165 TaxID=2485105 RepID=UPI00105275FE|nr:hypothetical protein [Novosphingobium sp. PhB165]TCM16962.1 putative phiE125 gp8 family phage protein [Novosphingobium sp. PhB165]
MNRVILTPAVLPSSALAELKQWLGVTTARDDAPLSGLLASALDIFEAFTAQLPFTAQCEEVLPARPGWNTLATRPVQAITAVDSIDADGTRFALPAGTYEVDLCADGSGCVRLPILSGATRVAVRFTAGLAADWDGLPNALRHGIIRFAAHQHRERESAGAAPLPPASVAALWRPWRRMRLA